MLTSLEIGLDRPRGFVAAFLAEPTGGASHEEGSRAAWQLPELCQGHVVLSTAVAAVQEQVVLLQACKQVRRWQGFPNAALQ